MKLQTSFTITMAVMFTIFVITIRNLSALPTRTSFISTTKVSRLNNQSSQRRYQTGGLVNERNTSMVKNNRQR